MNIIRINIVFHIHASTRSYWLHHVHQFSARRSHEQFTAHWHIFGNQNTWRKTTQTCVNSPNNLRNYDTRWENQAIYLNKSRYNEVQKHARACSISHSFRTEFRLLESWQLVASPKGHPKGPGFNPGFPSGPVQFSRLSFKQTLHMRVIHIHIYDSQGRSCH